MKKTKLVELIKEYNCDGKLKLYQELNYYKNLKSLTEVIQVSIYKSNGKKHAHQRRIKLSALEKVRDVLLNVVNKIKNCDSFESLIKFVEKETIEIKGIGDLVIYDVSLRIGANKNIYPTKVYIHAGVKKGCKNLRINDKAKTIAVAEFPTCLNALRAYEIENFLCIYKKDLKNIEY